MRSHADGQSRKQDLLLSVLLLHHCRDYQTRRNCAFAPNHLSLFCLQTPHTMAAIKKAATALAKALGDHARQIAIISAVKNEEDGVQTILSALTDDEV